MMRMVTSKCNNQRRVWKDGFRRSLFLVTLGVLSLVLCQKKVSRTFFALEGLTREHKDSLPLFEEIKGQSLSSNFWHHNSVFDPINVNKATSPRRQTVESSSKQEGHAGEEELELSIETSYEDIYNTLVFLGAVFLIGKLFSLVGMPSLVGEIICGFLLGPPLANFVPFPRAMVLIGDIGLILLLLEAGIEIDVAQLKETGGRALAIACTGSVLPLLIGFGLAIAAGNNVRSALAVGMVFSPTSLGVASNALSSGKMLNTPVGQVIVASCVLDDIIGLVLLSILQVLVDDDAEIWEYFVPVVSAFGFLLFLGWCGLTWLPRLVESRIMPLFPEDKRDLAALGLMLLLLMAYLPLLNYTRASYLTGAFLAGLSFSQIHSVHKTFIHSTTNLMKWLLRIFFSASIGFQVPITTFWEPRVIGWGCAFYVCVLAKLPLGLFMPQFHTERLHSRLPFDPWKRDALVTGLAMTCRGEFSFIIAAFSLGEGIFDSTTYSSVIWAILLSCITSPLMLLFTIFYYNKRSRECVDLLKAAVGKVPLHLVIQCRSGLKWGLQTHLSQCATSLGLTIIDQRSWHPRGMDAVVVSELFVQDSKIEVVIRDEAEVDSDKDEEEGEQASESHMVQKRCAEIRKEMLRIIDQAPAEVKVIRWMPHILNEGDSTNINEKLESEARLELDKAEVIDTLLDVQPKAVNNRSGKQKSQSGPIERLCTTNDFDSDNESSIFMPPIEEVGVIGSTSVDAASTPVTGAGETSVEIAPPTAPTQMLRRRKPRHKTLSVPIFATNDMWEHDEETQLVSRLSAFVPTVIYDLSNPSYGQASRYRQVSELSQLIEESILPTVEDHLEGFVRHDIQNERGEDSAE